jgi:hypothetical protein
LVLRYRCRLKAATHHPDTREDKAAKADDSAGVPRERLREVGVSSSFCDLARQRDDKRKPVLPVAHYGVHRLYRH